MTSSLPKPLVLAGFVSFLLMGVVQAMYGPALLFMRAHFSLTVEASNLLFSLFFVGVLSMVLTAGLLERQVSRFAVLFCSTACVGLGTLLVGLATTWPLVLVGALLTGFGYGGHVLNFNTLFASSFGARGTAMTNLLNAVWSFGAILGPVLIAWSPNDFRLPFLVCGALSLLSLPLILGARALRLATTNPGNKVVRSGHELWVFASIAFLYVGMEVSVGASQPRHLLEVFGLPATVAAFWSSLFWLGQALGRVVVAPVSLRVPVGLIVLACLLGCVIALVMAHLPGVAPFGYALCGFFAGPIFPSMLAWLNARAKPSLAQTSWVIASGNLGGVLFPPLVALLSRDARLIPGLILLIALVNAALTASLWRKPAEQA